MHPFLYGFDGAGWLENPDGPETERTPETRDQRLTRLKTERDEILEVCAHLRAEADQIGREIESLL